MQMETQTVVIGSRESRLAVIQSEWVIQRIQKAYPEIHCSLVTMKTTGDRILDRPLTQVGGKGLFVKELDRALLERRIDLSVHSLKDMPMEQPEGLPIVAYSKREDPRDVLILPKGSSKLDFEKPIGSSSLRRMIQLKRLFPEAKIESVRGNVQTRLAKLDSGQYSGLVLAAAGIRRMGLEERISRIFSPEELLPAAGQGILAVQGRAGESHFFLDAVEDPAARAAALAERAFVRYLDGGCTSPVAAYAKLDDTGHLLLTGLYWDEAHQKVWIDQIEGEWEAAEQLGIQLAKRMKQKG